MFVLIPLRNQKFRASWLRPTPDRFAAEENFPAGIPLHPRVLQYYEDSDCIEFENIKLRFSTAEERIRFGRTYLVTKKDWTNRHQENDERVKVSRKPDRLPQLPGGVYDVPMPEKKVPFRTSVDKERPPKPLFALVPKYQQSILGSARPTSTNDTDQCRHDAALDDRSWIYPDSGRLAVPETRKGWQTTVESTESRTISSMHNENQGGERSPLKQVDRLDRPSNVSVQDHEPQLRSYPLMVDHSSDE